MSKEKLELGYHVVAFLDLTGQQKKLEKLSKLPEKHNQEERDEALVLLRQTYGAVNTMRASFNRYLNGFKKAPLDKRLTNNVIQVHQFSDFVMGFMSLRTDQVPKLPIRGILGIIGAVAITSLDCLASSHPVRGGIDIGVSLEINSNEIYGPSIARAYKLESQISKYPRIVVGSELYEYIEATASQAEVDNISIASVRLAKECLELLIIDGDGCVMVDFMGKNIRERYREMDGFDSIELVQKAYDFVNKSYVYFKESKTKDKDKELESRYASLKTYMESRLDLWDVNIQQDND